jgi:predicted RNase H-like HicB family nuclease
VSAFGDTPAEARRELDVALKLTREVYAEEGWPLPDTRRAPHKRAQQAIDRGMR